ncbi:alanine racemase [Actinoplanes digitatis]|uniref:Alanine racemase n=1 Tax=Actinoplanes digitatis TaxID=1868 RepID=A0A7W7MTK6_9ACTN|nr:alanine racemase [Actinoplanes digitatis]
MSMWQAEVRIDLDAIRDNVETLRAGTTAEVMAVVKADGYGHGMLPSARAALAGGATWLGAATLDEALTLRRAGITAPVLAWLLAPGLPLHEGVTADVDLNAASLDQLGELVTAARRAGRPARVHLKIDTGLARGGATPAEWPALLEAAAKAQAGGEVEVVGIWSHFVYADAPGHETVDHQLAVFAEGLATAEQFGIEPRYRHIANSAATLTRPDAHYDLVRPGIAVYGLSPLPAGHETGLRPAMTARARVTHTKRVPAGQGVSYGHAYYTARETTLALVPLGYADGVPRHASNVGPVWLGGRTRTIAGRVCMDQIVLDCGDDPVAPGDVATLFGPGDDGMPTATDWADAVGTINYEIVTRFGGSRVSRVYDGTAGVPTPDPAGPDPAVPGPAVSGPAVSGSVVPGSTDQDFTASGAVDQGAVVRDPGAPGAVASAEEVA